MNGETLEWVLKLIHRYIEDEHYDYCPALDSIETIILLKIKEIEQ